MIILLVLAVSIAFALVRGGKFSNLGLIRLRWLRFIFLGFVIQLAIFQKYWQENAGTRPLTPFAYLVSLLFLLGALAKNLQIPGMRLIFLGFLLNFLAILSNGGYMPVLLSARAISGQSPLAPGQIANNVIGANDATLFWFLGDVFAIPKGFPFPNVFSVGDLLIAVGAAYLIYRGMLEKQTSEV